MAYFQQQMPVFQHKTRNAGQRPTWWPPCRI